MYAVRFVQGLVCALAAWVTLAMGGGLYAVAMMPMSGAIVAAIWLFVRRRHMIAQAGKNLRFPFGR